MSSIYNSVSCGYFDGNIYLLYPPALPIPAPQIQYNNVQINRQIIVPAAPAPSLQQPPDGANVNAEPKKRKIENLKFVDNHPKRGRPLKIVGDLVCVWCKTTETYEWRRGPEGVRLCNACGLRYAKQKKMDSVSALQQEYNSIRFRMSIDQLLN